MALHPSSLARPWRSAPQYPNNTLNCSPSYYTYKIGFNTACSNEASSQPAPSRLDTFTIPSLTKPLWHESSMHLVGHACTVASYNSTGPFYQASRFLAMGDFYLRRLHATQRRVSLHVHMRRICWNAVRLKLVQLPIHDGQSPPLPRNGTQSTSPPHLNLDARPGKC